VWDPRTYEDTDYGLDEGETFEPEDAGREYDEIDVSSPHIMTVLGPIEPEELGICLVREHLLANPEGFGDSDFLLDDEDFASEEIEAFVTRGGRAVVEGSTADYGRNASGLVRLAMRAPMHLIAVTGRQEALHASRMANALDADSLAAEFIADLQTGMDGTDARAGLIVVWAGKDEMEPAERATLSAAVSAHRETGVPILADGVSGLSPTALVDALLEVGVPPGQVIAGGLDAEMTFERVTALAGRGVFLAFDRIGKPSPETDRDLADMMVRLMAAGYGGQLLVSHGHARRSDYIAYGGTPGLTHITERFLLELMEAGAEALQVRAVLIENPARALTIAPPGREVGATDKQSG